MLSTPIQLITKSIDLYKANAQLFLRYMLFLFIPTGLIGIISVIFENSFTIEAENIVFLGTGQIVFYIAIMIIFILAAFWVTLAFIRVVADSIEGKKTKRDIKTELHTTAPLILATLWVSILSALVIFGGVIFFLIPGIIFSVWFSFVLYSVVLEGKHGTEALRHSKNLVSGRWWAVLWRLIIPALIFSLFIIVFQTILEFPLNKLIKSLEAGTLVSTITLMISSLFYGLLSVLITPLSTAASTILYLELRKHPMEEKKKK